MVENETTDDFIAQVVSRYLERIQESGRIPNEHMVSIESDLRDEVLEMLRKKTYGHYSLAEYRKAKAASPASAPIEQTGGAEKPAPRSRRTC